jgi:formamidopyrimidine-DNA glycosylase
MPEGPEVRKYADLLNTVLGGRVVKSLEACTREARSWLQTNEECLRGRRLDQVISHGKHLLGFIEGDFYFHSHLMMWGRWQTFAPEAPVARDRRERARIVVEGGAAILFSAPIFNVGKGDPYKAIENLTTLGPDVLPYNGGFDKDEFRHRLLLPQHLDVTIGAALLNQRILAGLGNYLRAEILFSCRLNPWRKVASLTTKDLACLCKTIPTLARRAYQRNATASNPERHRMRTDPSLVYQPGREYGTRHLVFRRTNLPCLRCGEKIKQLRQKTYDEQPPVNDLGLRGEAVATEERTRIVYYCAKCQKVDKNPV